LKVNETIPRRQNILYFVSGLISNEKYPSWKKAKSWEQYSWCAILCFNLFWIQNEMWKSWLIKYEAESVLIHKEGLKR